MNPLNQENNTHSTSSMNIQFLTILRSSWLLLHIKENIKYTHTLLCLSKIQGALMRKVHDYFLPLELYLKQGTNCKEANFWGMLVINC